MVQLLLAVRCAPTVAAAATPPPYAVTVGLPGCASPAPAVVAGSLQPVSAEADSSGGGGGGGGGGRKAEQCLEGAVEVAVTEQLARALAENASCEATLTREGRAGVTGTPSRGASRGDTTASRAPC